MLNLASRPTLSRAAAIVDVAELDKAVCGGLARLVPMGGQDAVAIDGKELRGAKNDGGKTTRLLVMVTHGACLMRGQVEVGVKTNEIPRFAVLPDQIEDITGLVVTADALHSQCARRLPGWSSRVQLRAISQTSEACGNRSGAACGASGSSPGLSPHSV